MTNREFSELFPDAYAMCKDMQDYAPGLKVSYVKTADFEQGEPTEGVPATVDHYGV